MHLNLLLLPKRSDQITIVHDGSHVGIGSVLYLKRHDSIKLGGYFSAKLKSHQIRWYPCEIEALSISQSNERTNFGNINMDLNDTVLKNMSELALLNGFELMSSFRYCPQNLRIKIFEGVMIIA